MPDPAPDAIDAADNFLAECVRCAGRGEPFPDWPTGLAGMECTVSGRIAFHGIALLLINSGSDFPGWPQTVLEAARDEARIQPFWEDDHRTALSILIEALHQAGIETAVMKGTALAYSVYPNPALRRRGDTDLLIEHAPRKSVRTLLRASGFHQRGDRRPLQESWAIATDAGFTHEIDLHWRISASMAVSQAFERDHPRKRLVALPRLSAHAKSIAPLDSFIQICMNRAAHDEFGYLVEDRKVFGGNRLVWAIDLDRLGQSFGPHGWDSLARIATCCGAAGIVASGMDFARRTLGSSVPEAIEQRLLQAAAGDDTISRYFTNRPALTRMSEDMAGADTFADKAAFLISHLFPGREFMANHFPGSDRWPIPLLWARRVLDAGWRKLLGGQR